MNLQQSTQPRSSINGFGRRRVDREIGPKIESKTHTGKAASCNFGNAENGGTSGDMINDSRDRLIYVISYLLGLRVEVHVRNGSIISGIFHATNTEKDFAIVLKKAQVTKDGSVRAQKPMSEAVKKPMDMIIQAKDLVQVVAQDVPLNIEEFSNAYPHEKRKDLMIDLAISSSRHLEAERELERWTSDAGDADCPELEDIFDGTWNRKWDQFETNAALFGVKSTFNEELYTTKLEKGPRMRELEREATRIAREIEGEETRDLHLAEERGIQLDEDFDLDEELKYSAVRREIDDNTFGESRISSSDTYNTETFGSSHGGTIPKSYADISRSKFTDGAHVLSTCSSVDAGASSEIHSGKDADPYSSEDTDISSADNIIAKKSAAINDKSRLGEKHIKNQVKETSILNEGAERTALEKAQTSQDKALQSSADAKDLSSSTAANDQSSSSQDSERSNCGHSERVTSAANELVNPSLRSGTSAPSTSERISAGLVSSGPGLSPSSSMGSLSSEKSTLNPNAKVGPSFGGHQHVFNAQSAQLQSSQAYIHPSGPLYGQQVILGQPQPVYYMPTYPPCMFRILGKLRPDMKLGKAGVPISGKAFVYLDEFPSFQSSIRGQ
ncbi:uncharacterized protein A4U43_C09F4850 [Asparagus officinalis]|uniref:LsmAD domain-containing protein n=1 Tax=Asparagus officinalis TaxID=4686 RepID=A0A5P1E5M0_ASPOF|nr:uncharacterized protein A4U43_C09F4850 [Asparagus officinalis]